MDSLIPYIDIYGNREVTFQFRGRSYCFTLSLELFSSAGIDVGSRFLLKVFSDYIDTHPEHLAGKAPCSVLDAGSGVGVLGICAAGALRERAKAFRVRAQDRDELARIFTEYNGERNGLSKDCFQAHTEPLLSGPEGQHWDLILTNIPAKAGRGVLEDFIFRSVSILNKDGRVFLVAVNTLANFFRSCISAAEASLLAEEQGKEHTVFVYTAGEKDKPSGGSLVMNGNFPRDYPFYVRNQSQYEMEDISYQLDTVEGAPDFDNPGGAVQAAAKLAVKIDLAAKLSGGENSKTSLLIYDAGQGHFAVWLANYLKAPKAGAYHWVLLGRNILGLAAARAALSSGGNIFSPPESSIISPTAIPIADIFLDRERIGKAGDSSLISFFPETVPEAAIAWEGITWLTAPGGIVMVGMTSAEADRFDRKKAEGFIRLGDIKRKGFRAMAYRKG